MLSVLCERFCFIFLLTLFCSNLGNGGNERVYGNDADDVDDVDDVYDCDAGYDVDGVRLSVGVGYVTWTM